MQIKDIATLNDTNNKTHIKWQAHNNNEENLYKSHNNNKKVIINYIRASHVPTYVIKTNDSS